MVDVTSPFHHQPLGRTFKRRYWATAFFRPACRGALTARNQCKRLAGTGIVFHNLDSLVHVGKGMDTVGWGSGAICYRTR